jgi:hypothetical protein
MKIFTLGADVRVIFCLPAVGLVLTVAATGGTTSCAGPPGSVGCPVVDINFAGQAPITWGAATNETGVDTDVSNPSGSGATFLESAFAGSSAVTLNGVTFTPQPSSTNITFSASWTLTAYNCCGGTQVPGGYTPEYTSLVEQGDYVNNGSGTITIGGLTVGDSYQIQIFQPYWNTANFSTQYSDGVGHNVVITSGDSAGVTAQYVIGTFTASTLTSEFLNVSPGSSGDINWAAISVFDTTEETPEPASVALCMAGLSALALKRWHRRRSRLS